MGGKYIFVHEIEGIFATIDHQLKNAQCGKHDGFTVATKEAHYCQYQ